MNLTASETLIMLEAIHQASFSEFLNEIGSLKRSQDETYLKDKKRSLAQKLLQTKMSRSGTSLQPSMDKNEMRK